MLNNYVRLDQSSDRARLLKTKDIADSISSSALLGWWWLAAAVCLLLDVPMSDIIENPITVTDDNCKNVQFANSEELETTYSAELSSPSQEGKEAATNAAPASTNAATRSPDTSSPWLQSDRRLHSLRLSVENDRFDLVTGRLVARTQVIRRVSDLVPPQSRLHKWIPFWKKAEMVDSTDLDATDVYRIQSSSRRGMTRQVLLDGNCKYSFLSEYLRWTFRASFFEVTIAAYLLFLLLTVVFALLVFSVGRYQPQCISAGGESFTAAGTDFMDGRACVCVCVCVSRVLWMP